MKGRNPTAEEKRHMASVRRLGCIVCRNLGYEISEDITLIHHIEGKTKPDAHFKVLPLCDPHHSRYFKTGLHYNKTAWEKENGNQYDLLERVNSLL